MKKFINVQESYDRVCWKSKDAIVTQQSSFVFDEYCFFWSLTVNFIRISNFFSFLKLKCRLFKF